MKTIKHEFVEFIPEVLEQGLLYVSMRFSTAAHLCVCGCGNKVITPITPTDWSIEYNGESITLNPSIGNWNFDCQSHYFIRKGQILKCSKWSKSRIEKGRKYDSEIKRGFFGDRKKYFWSWFV